MKKNIILFCVICAVAVAEAKVLVVVGKTGIITDEDLNIRLSQAPAQYAQYYSTAEGKNRLLDQMIEEKKLYLKAAAAGYDKNPEVLKAIKLDNENVMTNYFLKDELSKIQVSAAEINKYYSSNKAEFMEDASVRASHILVKTEEEAKAAMNDLSAGKDFAEEAKAKSICPSAAKGGDLGFFTKGQMVPEFEAAAFSLNSGEMTKSPIKTQFGWHIIKVTDLKPAGQKDLKVVSDQIKDKLLQEKKRTWMQKYMEQLKAEIPVEKKS
jgi:peptidyl-prolyl cis-trans isomerase C